MQEPPVSAPVAKTDHEHLELLVIFHYVVAGLGALLACFPFFHVAMGVMMLNGTLPMEPAHPAGAFPPRLFAYFFIGMGLFFILCGWALAACTFLSGRFLKRREKRTFSFVVACVLCLFVPFGTALGVFTLVVLSRDSVRALYATQRDPRA